MDLMLKFYFVMLGTRSKGAVDPYFHRNIQQASAAGVKVGVYIYSLAMTPEMAVEEANFVLNLIHDYPVSYPVAFDMEDSTQGTLSKDELAAIANAFCGRISEAGYYPVIYLDDPSRKLARPGLRRRAFGLATSIRRTPCVFKNIWRV